ncbi:MAG TPA: hypothetical protein ENN99_05790 [Chloroflexi bacterium]|nr:hypothetical protein [Chloroflexota bacterium]
MSRVISLDGPGKTRNHHRRTIAEALRLLTQKPQLDEEARDLAALIVFCLHGIADTVDQTIGAWEKRDYWMKAERFREEWRWLDPLADELSTVIYRGMWDQLPVILARLMPYFSDVKVKKMTRDPALWHGAYQKLVEEG